MDTKTMLELAGLKRDLWCHATAHIYIMHNIIYYTIV